MQKFIEPEMVKIIHQKPTKTMTIEMVHLPKGRFMMGEDSEQREVVIDYEFEMGKYPVTFYEYDMFCEDTKREKPKDEGWGRGRRPVINVSWYDAVAFCKWLSEKSNQNYRLPTEIEWEYACRAGTDTKWSFGDDEKELDKYAWYDENSNAMTHSVGEKLTNFWGLHDMYGNVWERCFDKYKNSSTISKDIKKYMILDENLGERRRLCGGSWGSNSYVLSSNQGWNSPNKWHSDVGFRLLRTLP